MQEKNERNETFLNCKQKIFEQIKKTLQAKKLLTNGKKELTSGKNGLSSKIVYNNVLQKYLKKSVDFLAEMFNL